MRSRNTESRLSRLEKAVEALQLFVSSKNKNKVYGKSKQAAMGNKNLMLLAMKHHLAGDTRLQGPYKYPNSQKIMNNHGLRTNLRHQDEDRNAYIYLFDAYANNRNIGSIKVVVKHNGSFRNQYYKLVENKNWVKEPSNN